MSNSWVRPRCQSSAFDASTSLTDKLLELVTPGSIPLDVLYQEVKLGANAGTDLADDMYDPSLQFIQGLV